MSNCILLLLLLLLLLFYAQEAVVRRCSVKKASLEILQNSQENTFTRGSGVRAFL